MMRRMLGPVATLIWLFFCAAAMNAEAISYQFPARDSSLIVLDCPQAHVRISTCDCDEIRIDGKVTYDQDYINDEDLFLSESIHEQVLKIEPKYPGGSTGRTLKKHAWLNLTLTVPRDRSMRIEIGKGSVEITGPVARELVVKVKKGKVLYEQGQVPVHDLEARVVFGRVISKIPDLLPRPFFPFGKRVFVLSPEGKGKIQIRVTYGRITVTE